MSGFNFMDLAKAEFGRRVGQAAVTGQKIQSDRGPAKANPVQTSSAEKVSRKRAKAEKGRKKDKRSRERGARVAGAVGDFAGAVAAGLLADGAIWRWICYRFCAGCSANRGLWQDHAWQG